MNLEFLKRKMTKQKPSDENNLGFGQIFTDHMLMMKYDQPRGWYYAKIEPFADLQISPAALVFHYAQEIFEGLKAYRTLDGRILLFRPWDNIKRFARSAARMAMAPFNEDFVLNALYELIRLEKEWVPSTPGTSLYIRPTYIGVDPHVGISAATEYLLYIILSPVGAYYPTGLNPIDIYVENKFSRASKGGTGDHKAGANYGISLLAGREAKKKGFSQVLWLDSVENEYVEEVGNMNIFFKVKGKLVTPELQGTILPGITRDSIITLARDMGVEVAEERISINELHLASRAGELEEAFGSGTAAVISPIKRLIWGDQEIVVGGGRMGDLTKQLYHTLTGIQYGKIPDQYGWIKEV